MEAVEHALVIYEDQERMRLDKPPRRYRLVVMPQRQIDMVRMLNWKVWTMRYKIPLHFILTFVMRVYPDQRRASRDPMVLNFGFQTALVTGVAFRKRLEEEVVRRYPQGENYADARNPRRAHLPLKALNYDSVDEMAEKYDAVMRERHRESVKTAAHKRPYRR